MKSNILIISLLVVVAFVAGNLFNKIQTEKSNKNVQGAQVKLENPAIFEASKNKKPKIEFFVMSYCPYGNQVETALQPVVGLLGDKVEWQPRYITSEITQEIKDACEASCPQRLFNDENKKRCEEAIEQGQLPDMETCKQYFPYNTVDECIAGECDPLEIGKFDSLHGEEELKQNVREICAFNIVEDKTKWWQFVNDLNANCTLSNIGSCWQQSAEKSGFDVSKIEECANNQQTDLLRTDIAAADQMGGVSGSPTIFINGVLYPPDEAYKSGLRIGETDFNANQLRTPEVLKTAICNSFENSPKECKTILSSQAATGDTGDCE